MFLAIYISINNGQSFTTTNAVFDAAYSDITMDITGSQIYTSTGTSGIYIGVNYAVPTYYPTPSPSAASSTTVSPSVESILTYTWTNPLSEGMC